MKNPLVVFSPEAVFDSFDMLPVGTGSRDPARAFELFKASRASYESPSDLDLAIGDLSRDEIVKLAEVYTLSAGKGSLVGAAMLKISSEASYPIAISGPRTPDRFAILMGIGVKSRYEVAARGFGYTTLRQAQEDESVIGYHEGELRQYFEEVNADGLIVVTTGRHIRTSEPHVLGADLRIVDGIPLQSREHAISGPTSFCFYRQERQGRSGWVEVDEGGSDVQKTRVPSYRAPIQMLTEIIDRVTD